MDHLQHLVPDGASPPRAAYSHVIRSRGDVVWLAGQVPVDENGDVVGPGDPRAQVQQTVANVERVLAAAGAGWSDVVRMVVYVVGAENVAPVRELRETLWRKLYPDGRFPTSTLVVVDGLASGEFLVEIEATAVVARDEGSLL